MSRLILSTAVVMTVFATAAVSPAAELPSALKLGEHELVLNGSGTRQQLLLDMYVIGLYLEEPNQQARTIVETDALMVIRIEITSRLVSQEKLFTSLLEGFEKSTNGKLDPIRDQIDQFRPLFAEKITRGDVFNLVYVPDRGVLVFKNDEHKGEVAGLEFKRALFGIWLGERPVTEELRDSLLGIRRR